MYFQQRIRQTLDLHHFCCGYFSRLSPQLSLLILILIVYHNIFPVICNALHSTVVGIPSDFKIGYLGQEAFIRWRVLLSNHFLSAY